MSQQVLYKIRLGTVRMVGGCGLVLYSGYPEGTLQRYITGSSIYMMDTAANTLGNLMCPESDGTGITLRN